MAKDPSKVKPKKVKTEKEELVSQFLQDPEVKEALKRHREAAAKLHKS